jgi:hypothetical protein
MNPLLHHSRRLLLAAATAASMLAACGGDGLGSGGTGASPETFATGTVDGFGSVYIGGERCDHVGARIAWDTFSGGPEEVANANPDLKLGQRVEVDLVGGDLCRIVAARIAPEVIGVVETTSPLVVAGATVLVNTDPAQGPVTVFDGYDSAADISAGDRVEVHGKAVPHGAGVAIQATRIERKPSDPTWVRVAGVISDFDGTAQTFKLGALSVQYSSGTTIVPAGFALRNGLTIAMWSTGAVVNNSVDARYIRVLRRQFADQQKVRVQGPVRGCNGANPCKEFSVDGIDVLVNDDTVFRGSATVADIADGKTVHVRGTIDATGKLVARAIAVRAASDGVVTLLGSVSDFTDDGTTKTFRVRGVPVTADDSKFVGCSLTSLDNDKVVAVAGQIVGATVVADRVVCPTLAVGTIVDGYGSITLLDTGAKTFHFSFDPNRPLVGLATLHWDDNTVFSNVADPTTLANGDYVAVRGVYMGPENGFLLLRVVKDQTPPSVPGGGLLFSAIGIAHHVSSTSMWVNRVPMGIAPASDVDPGVVNGAVVRAWFYRHNGAWEVIKAYPLPW